MFEEKAGELAGKIWEALNEAGELTGKEIKKAIKTRSDKDLFLGLGWLLRSDHFSIQKDYLPTHYLHILDSYKLFELGGFEKSNRL